MFIGAWVIIVGAVIACSSSTIAQITVGRFILGGGIAIMTVGAPAYAIEIAPAHWRGRCTGKLPSTVLEIETNMLIVIFHEADISCAC